MGSIKGIILSHSGEEMMMIWCQSYETDAMRLDMVWSRLTPPLLKGGG